jgi:hypothetical protein
MKPLLFLKKLDCRLGFMNTIAISEKCNYSRNLRWAAAPTKSRRKMPTVISLLPHRLHNVGAANRSSDRWFLKNKTDRRALVVQPAIPTTQEAEIRRFKV